MCQGACALTGKSFFGGKYEIDFGLDGAAKCSDPNATIATAEECQEAANAWAAANYRPAPTVDAHEWDGTQGCHVQNGPCADWQFNANFHSTTGEVLHTPVCHSGT